MILSTLHSLALYPASCPKQFKSINNKRFKELTKHFIAHKLEAFCYHLYNCRYCSSFLSKKQRLTLKRLRSQKLLLKKFINQETNNLNRLFKKSSIQAFLYKDLVYLPIYKTDALFQTSSDIDILVEYKNYDRTSTLLQKNSWKLKEDTEQFSRLLQQRWQERVFTKKDIDLVKVDLQWAIAMTLKNPLNLLIKLDQKVLVADTFNKIKKNGLITPPKHIQLIFAIAHFFLQDQCFGFRQALEIKEIALDMEAKEWRLCLLVINKHKLQKIFWFTLLIIEKLFSQKIIPDNFNSEYSFKNLLLSSLFPILELQNITIRTGTRMAITRLRAFVVAGLAML